MIVVGLVMVELQILLLDQLFDGYRNTTAVHLSIYREKEVRIVSRQPKIIKGNSE